MAIFEIINTTDSLIQHIIRIVGLCWLIFVCSGTSIGYLAFWWVLRCRLLQLIKKPCESLHLICRQLLNSDQHICNLTDCHIDINAIVYEHTIELIVLFLAALVVCIQKRAGFLPVSVSVRGRTIILHGFITWRKILELSIFFNGIFFI